MANRNRKLFATAYSLFALLFLLSGNRFGRPLARARIGVRALTTHRQPAAVTQATIATEVHQALDVDAYLATKIALDHVVAIDHFADLQHFLVGQLTDATVGRNLHLLHDLGGSLRADAVDILKRDQHALVGRDVHTGNTGHELLSCRRSLRRTRPFQFEALSGVHKREHDALPAVVSGHGIVKKLSDWMWGLLKDESAFRQPPPAVKHAVSLPFSTAFAWP